MCVCAQLCVTLWDPMDRSLPDSSVKFARQELWRGLPFPPAGDLPDPEIEPKPFVYCALVGRFFTTEPPGKP